MDRKTGLAMILCFLIFFGWQKFFVESRHPLAPGSSSHAEKSVPDAQNITENIAQNSAQDIQQGITRSAVRPTLETGSRVPVQKLTLVNGTGEATTSNSSAILLDWTLKNYRLGLSSQAQAVDLQSVTHQATEVTLAFDDVNLAYIPEVQGQITPTPQGAQWTYSDKSIQIVRNIQTSPQTPYMDVELKAEFKGKPPKFAFVYLTSQGMEKDPEAQDRQLIYFTNKAISRIPLKDSIEEKEILTPIKYIAATNRYFLIAAVAQSPTAPSGLIQPMGPNGGRMSLVYPITGQSMTIPIRVYFGPKVLEILRQVEPTLDYTVDFGWFTIFAYPLLNVLQWFYQFVKNYGLAIILLTLSLKVITYPLTYKSMKSMKKMAKLQPQLQKIREKYKDDREALNREMLVMMRSHGYNPMSGCLPMIVQMPIFFALYRVLYSSIELYHAPFVFWIKDLSSHDPFYVTPVLLSLTMFMQQKLTPNTATDPAQARMMQLMPLIFGAFMLALPSGLTIYMLVNALASIVQQLILNKKFEGAAAH